MRRSTRDLDASVLPLRLALFAPFTKPSKNFRERRTDGNVYDVVC
jgi:hypothetical protein